MVAPKKKTRVKRASKLDSPELSKRALVLGDLTADQSHTAQAVVQEHGRIIPERMKTEAPRLRQMAEGARARGKASNAKTYDSKAARYERIGPQLTAANREPSTVEVMAKRQLEAVKAGATTYRMPHESLPGTGWYLDANRQVAKAAPAGFPEAQAVTSSSIMSVGAKPENERASMGAAAHAIHSKAKITLTGTTVAHLASKGVHLPDHHVGDVVEYGSLPGHVAAALADTGIRSHMKTHSSDVDWDGISRVSNSRNRAKAHEVLTGRLAPEDAQSPITAPKTRTYTSNIINATTATPDQRDIGNEYLARGAHQGDLIRGNAAGEQDRAHPYVGKDGVTTAAYPERHGNRVGVHTDEPKNTWNPERATHHVGTGQEMLDLWGKRSSHESILSPTMSTPQDSWQMGIQHVGLGPQDPVTGRHPQAELMKAAGDITLGSKTRRLRSGKKVSAAPSARVTPAGVAHAVHDAATIRSAEMLTEETRPGYHVASALMQETGWTAARRATAKGDKDYNKEHRKPVRAAHAEAVKLNPNVSPAQMGLF